MNIKIFPGKLKVLFIALLYLGVTFSAQAQKLNLNLKDVTIKNALKEITSQTGYNFLYSDALRGLDKKIFITHKSQNETISMILDKLFVGTDIIYTIKGKQVALHNKKIQAGSSSIQVRGTITDDLGEPLPGVTVQNKSNGKFTASEIDGTYTIEASEGNLLSFASIGMAVVDAVVGRSTVLNVNMKADAIALEDVVVTGYQTISKERATGSFDIVKSDKLNKPSTDIGQRLVGNYAGVSSKTDVDGNIIFEIRGQSSLETSAQPLVVVDGFAIEGGLSSLNPNDIESITILKDAASASIWGAKSANGVIVVTSKTNRTKKELTIEFNSFWKFSPKLDLGYLSPHASSSETVDYETMGFNSRFFGGFTSPIENGNGYSNLYAYYTGVVQTLNEARLGFISQTEAEAQLNEYRNFNNRQQLKDHILDNPFTQQYNLTMMGSTKKTDNVLSLLYEKSNTNYKGSNRDKYLVNFRNVSRIYKWLDFNFYGSFGYRSNKDNSVPYDWSPYQKLLEEDGSYAAVPYNYYLPNIQRHVPIGKFPYTDWTYNPIKERESRNFNTREISFRAQAGLTFKIIEGLNISTKFQYEGINTAQKNIYSEGSFEVRSVVNEASTWDRKSGEITQNLPNGAFMDQGKTDIYSYNWRNQVTFGRTIAKKHDINVVAGMELSKKNIETVTNPRVYGYDNDRLTVGGFPNGTGGNESLKDWMGYDQVFDYTHAFASSTDEFFSLYANAAYTYNGKYSISASARTDASNLITDDPKYRYSPFLSFGMGWNIANEKFMKAVTWVDRLSLRMTYGSNGNIDKSTSFLPLLSVDKAQNTYINGLVSDISSYGNPNLRWEKTNMLDIGIDYTLFRGKLFGKIDFYNKQGKDLIVEMSIPSIYGTKKQMLNKAKMLNRGIEITIGTSHQIAKNIKWTGSLNLAYNYNTINDLYRISYKIDELTYMKTSEYLKAPWAKKTGSYVNGYNANTLWSFKYAGVKNTGSESSPNMQPGFYGKDGKQYLLSRTPPGDARNYLHDMGTTVAPFNIGFSNTFIIYDFDLSFTITGKFGHKFNALSFNYPAMTGGNAMPNKIYNEVLNANPNEMIPIPVGKSEPRYFYWDRFYPYMDYLVQSANHIRLQELNLTYNMPEKILNKIGFSSIKLYMQANNLFIITNNKYNEDPEYPMGSIKPGPSFTFGVNLTL